MSFQYRSNPTEEMEMKLRKKQYAMELQQQMELKKANEDKRKVISRENNIGLGSGGGGFYPSNSAGGGSPLAKHTRNNNNNDYNITEKANDGSFLKSISTMYNGLKPEVEQVETIVRKSEYSKFLEAQMEEKKQKKIQEKRDRENYERELNEKNKFYNPWGKSGSGAPLRDSAGGIVADLRKAKSENTSGAYIEEYQQYNNNSNINNMNSNNNRTTTTDYSFNNSSNNGNINYGASYESMLASKHQPLVSSGMNQTYNQTYSSNIINNSSSSSIPENNTSVNTEKKFIRFRASVEDQSRKKIEQAKHTNYAEDLQRQVDEKKRLKNEEKERENMQEARENERLDKQRKELEESFMKEKNKTRKGYKPPPSDVSIPLTGRMESNRDLTSYNSNLNSGSNNYISKIPPLNVNNYIGVGLNSTTNNVSSSKLLSGGIGSLDGSNIKKGLMEEHKLMDEQLRQQSAMMQMLRDQIDTVKREREQLSIMRKDYEDKLTVVTPRRRPENNPGWTQSGKENRNDASKYWMNNAGLDANLGARNSNPSFGKDNFNVTSELIPYSKAVSSSSSSQNIWSKSKVMETPDQLDQLLSDFVDGRGKMIFNN